MYSKLGSAFSDTDVASDLAQPKNPGSIYSLVPKTHSRIAEIGTLYTAIAGMLNLLAIIDSASRASALSRATDAGASA